MTYGITYSPLTGRINIGRTNKSHTRFHTKEDHTTAALIAAAEHVIEQHQGQVEMTPEDGHGPAYRLIAQRIDATAQLR